VSFRKARNLISLQEEVLVMVVEPRIVLEEEEEELEGEGEEGASMDVEVLSSKKTEE